MIRRCLLVLMLLGAPLQAGAVDYTDIWFNPSESGWGVNIVQSDKFLFVTYFIFGTDNKPVWYVANITEDSNGNFTGPLFVTTSGTYFAMPWSPQQFSGAQVGTATFQPTSPYTATLIYNITSGPVVTKTIERQSLTAIPLGGNYSGAQAGSYSNCSNGPYTDFFNLQVSQFSGGSITFAFNYGSGLSCTLSGSLSQHGQLSSVSSAAYKCSDGLNTNATMSEVKATAQGIEGRFVAPNVGNGCGEDATFSGVFLR